LPHKVLPAPHEMQEPPLQYALAGQATPQPPQFFGSEETCTSQLDGDPSQSAYPE
jgi:hypothetical protein